MISKSINAAFRSVIPGNSRIKVSIITVCRNSATTIRDTIESVLSQDYLNIEYIIVDGSSTDETMDIVREYGDRIAVVISEPDKGIYDAMNKGILLATGDYVGTLNSDDLFASKNVISDMALFLENNQQLDGVFGDLVFVHRDNVDYVSRKYTYKWPSVKLLRFGIIGPHPAFYVKRRFFKELGLYKMGYRVAADFELMTRFMTNGLRIGRHPHLMVKMREGGISTTGFWWLVHQNFEIVRACKENGIYTNIFLVALKIPIKLVGYLFR